MDSFQVDLALKFCERALQLEPENIHVMNTMATVLLEAGETDKAFEVHYYIAWLGMAVQ